jgi:glycosyltransferase involved in cell wall biosynthesis
MVQRTLGSTKGSAARWEPGTAPVAVVMISLNEAHNMEAALATLKGWAQEVFLVDSYSTDGTVDIALRHGVHVVQRQFRGFGDQWNFALRELPIMAAWTMKLDPDERMTDALRANLLKALPTIHADGLSFDRRLWFMGREMPADQTVLRVWRTGSCHFSDVTVNEHPIVEGQTIHIAGKLAHLDSPDLDHWLEKQNRYTTAEAIMAHQKALLSDTPKLFGTALQRRMWLKKVFYRVPFRYLLLFLYHWVWQGSWRAGFPGFAWARLRADVMRLVEYKRREITITGRVPAERMYGPGGSDERVRQYL